MLFIGICWSNPDLTCLVPPPTSHCAGVKPQTRARQVVRRLEQASLVACRIVPHAVVTLLVLVNPRAFGGMAYYLMALLGMAYCNFMNWHKAQLTIKPLQAQPKEHAA